MVGSNTHKIILVNEYVTRGLNSQVSQINTLSSAQTRLTKTTKATWTASENLAIANANAVKSMFGVSNSAKNTKGSLDHLLGSFTKLRWTLVNVALAAGVAYGAFNILVKPTIDLETEMSNVRKTTDLTKQEIGDLSGELIQLSKELPVSAVELAKIATIAGQLGIQGKEDLLSFTNTIALISSTTEMSAEDAATNMAKISAAFDLPIEQVGLLGSVINELSNTTASTASEISESLKRVGNSASQLGLSVETVSAFQATLISSGMRAERAATRMRSAFNAINADVEGFATLTGLSFEEFNRILEQDSERAFNLILQSLANIDSETERNVKIISLFGKVGGNAIQTLVNNYDSLQENVKNANKEMASGLSLVIEESKKLDTTVSQWELFKNELKESVYWLDLTGKGLIDFFRAQQKLSGIDKARSGLLGAFPGGVGLQYALGKSNQVERYIELRKEFEQLAKTADISSEKYDEMNQVLSETGISEAAIDSLVQYNKELGNIISRQSMGTSSIFQQKGLFDFGQQQSILPPTLQEKLNEYFKLRDKQKQLQDSLTTGSEEEVRALNEVNIAVEVATEKLGGYADEAEDAWDAMQKGTEVIEKQNPLLDALNAKYESLKNRLSGAGDALSKVKDQISATNDEINNILTRRFTINGISETGISNIVSRQELAIKKSQFEALGLGSAEDFLRNATVLTTNEINDQTQALKRLTEAASDSQDQYDSWQTSLNTTIRSLLINSQDLDKDVTEVVKKAQTELLSLTQGDKDKEDQFDAMTTNLDALKLAQDIFFGDEQQQLKYSEMLREDRINGVNTSAEMAINALQDERDYLQDLIEKEEYWIDVQDRIKSSIEAVTEAIKEQKEAQNSLNSSRGGSVSNSNFQQEVTSRFGGSYDSSGTYQSGNYGTARSIFNDFIARPGQPVAQFSPEDTVIGVKNPSQIMNNKSIGPVTININGSNQNARQLAIEIRRELSSLA